MDSNENAASSRRGARRTVLLIGTSFFVYAALPSAALAQDECGTPPGGEGNIVTCTTAGNPYPGGIDYTNEPEDLTIVLDPGVVVTDSLTATATAPSVDLRITGAVNTSITVTGATGVLNDASSGSTYTQLDIVTTTGAAAPGVIADSSDRTDVFVNSVSTSGPSSPGVTATITGPAYASEGQPVVFVDAGSVTTLGTSSGGIATSNPLGSIYIDSDAVETSGDGSVGISAGSVGPITIAAGTVETHGNNSGGITATSTDGDVTITAGSVSTEGATDSRGIYAAGERLATVTSGTVVTSGADFGGH